MFIISRLNDSSSYFFTWFCKRYRIRIGVRDLGGKEEIERCPICLDPCTKSIELQCGHAFCRSCLTTSAANNMTSCALCRRKQVINPEVLRARFDEQRMLNLAQRLAIPPPVRARPNISGASMSAGEAGGPKEGGANPASAPSADCGSDQKVPHREHAAVVTSRPVDVESMTSRGHLLFGPWGDVGAMSPGELRRRWKFSGVQSSAAPVAATVGAASPSELASSWRELQHMSRASMYMRGSREFVGTPLQVSHGSHATRAEVSRCSTDRLSIHEPNIHLGEVAPGRSSVPASPDSPCAGGAPLSELSARWRELARVPTGTTAVTRRASDAASYGRRPILSFAGQEFVDQLRLPGQMRVQGAERRTATSVDVAMRVDASQPPDEDAGSMSSGSLRRRWHKAFHCKSRDVGAADVTELAVRLAQAKGSQGVGGLSNAFLRKRWPAACTEDAEHEQDDNKHECENAVGDATKSGELAIDAPGICVENPSVLGSNYNAKLSILGEQSVGAASVSALYKRWRAAHGKGSRAAPVG